MIGDVTNTVGTKMTKKLPSSKPVLLKTYFVAMTPQGKNLGFKRNMYRLLDCKEDRLVL